MYGMTSTMTAEALTYFPIAYLTLRPMLATIDSNLEGMALSLGASRRRVFRTVTLPLCTPGLANAFLLLFAASLADFATPLILAGNQFPVLPTQAFLQITGLFDLRGGAALSLMLLVPALLVFVAQRYWVGRRHYVTVTGKGAGQTPFDSVTPLARWLLVGLCVAVTAFIVYLYVLLLYASLVLAFGANDTFTLMHYRVVFTEGLRVIGDTLIIAALATPLGGFYGVLLGYLVARKRFVGRRTMEVTSMINYALPGTIVGIGYLIAFNDPPIMLAGGATIIVACYVFRYGATGIRTTIALMQQVDRSLEEASQGLGASEQHNLSSSHLAADPARVLCRPRRHVHPCDDRDQRHDLRRLHQLDAGHSQDPGEHDRACPRRRRRVLGDRRGDRVLRDLRDRPSCLAAASRAQQERRPSPGCSPHDDRKPGGHRRRGRAPEQAFRSCRQG